MSVPKFGWADAHGYVSPNRAFAALLAGETVWAVGAWGVVDGYIVEVAPTGDGYVLRWNRGRHGRFKKVASCGEAIAVATDVATRPPYWWMEQVRAARKGE